jgi:hypothetical protein
MGPSPKRTTTLSDPTAQEIREQEVLRANRELSAYFRGRRTEREARAALKIIKTFIRDRARIAPENRRPFPGAESAKGAARTAAPRMTATPEKIFRREAASAKPDDIRAIKE